MDVVQNFRRVIRHNALSEYTLGILLGFEISNQEIDQAEENAMQILRVSWSFAFRSRHLGLLPSTEDVILCETPLLDAQDNPLTDVYGAPELCGLICKPTTEPSRSRLGFRWRCYGTHYYPGTEIVNRNRRHREMRLNPITNTMFTRAHIEYRKFLKILYSVFRGRDVTETIRLVGGSNTTSVDYYSLIREAVAICGWHDQRKIGGPGDIVEIDEVRLVNRKYNRGRIPVGDYWVFGGVSRATGRKFAMRVPDRTAITLHAEIVDCIERDSIICSDGWPAYQGITPGPNNQFPGLRDAQQNLLYRDHFTVIHEREFVNPQRDQPPWWRNDILPACRDMQYNGRLPAALRLGMRLPFRCHTQKVERQWRELRDTVLSSPDLETVDRYIGYWLYRENTLRLHPGTETEKFIRFVHDIRRVYPGPNITPITANRPGARMYPNQHPVPLCACDECA